nr:hypothetical protein CFP56_20424 [Quercus suber]
MTDKTCPDEVFRMARPPRARTSPISEVMKFCYPQDELGCFCCNTSFPPPLCRTRLPLSLDLVQHHSHKPTFDPLRYLSDPSVPHPGSRAPPRHRYARIGHTTPCIPLRSLGGPDVHRHSFETAIDFGQSGQHTCVRGRAGNRGDARFPRGVALGGHTVHHMYYWHVCHQTLQFLADQVFQNRLQTLTAGRILRCCSCGPVTFSSAGETCSIGQRTWRRPRRPISAKVTANFVTVALLYTRMMNVSRRNVGFVRRPHALAWRLGSTYADPAPFSRRAPDVIRASDKRISNSRRSPRSSYGGRHVLSRNARSFNHVKEPPVLRAIHARHIDTTFPCPMLRGDKPFQAGSVPSPEPAQPSRGRRIRYITSPETTDTMETAQHCLFAGDGCCDAKQSSAIQAHSWNTLHGRGRVASHGRVHFPSTRWIEQSVGRHATLGAGDENFRKRNYARRSQTIGIAEVDMIPMFYWSRGTDPRNDRALCLNSSQMYPNSSKVSGATTWVAFPGPAIEKGLRISRQEQTPISSRSFVSHVLVRNKTCSAELLETLEILPKWHLPKWHAESRLYVSAKNL